MRCTRFAPFPFYFSKFCNNNVKFYHLVLCLNSIDIKISRAVLFIFKTGIAKLSSICARQRTSTRFRHSATISLDRPKKISRLSNLSSTKIKNQPHPSQPAVSSTNLPLYLRPLHWANIHIFAFLLIERRSKIHPLYYYQKTIDWKKLSAIYTFICF